jgi:hypothetical protein
MVSRHGQGPGRAALSSFANYLLSQANAGRNFGSAVLWQIALLRDGRHMVCTTTTPARPGG